MPTSQTFRWKERLHASAIHLCLSLGISALAALLVFGIWYPYPYRDISGGKELFFLVVSVDVILGPLITLAVFNRAKPWAELRRDLAIVVALQLAALGYGLWTVCLARPVHLVFEYDRFRVVHAIEVPPELLPMSPPDIIALPLTGPTVLSLRVFRDSNEKAEATMAALQGLPLAVRPDLWQTYAKAQAEVVKVSRPVSSLITRFPERAAEIEAILAEAKLDLGTVAFLPLVGRKAYWTVFVNAISGEVVATMPLDSF